MNTPELVAQVVNEEFNSIKNNDKEYIVIPKTSYIDNILNGSRCGKIIIYNNYPEILYIDDSIEKRFETISKIGINELQLLISRDEEVRINRYRHQGISQFYVLYFKK